MKGSVIRRMYAGFSILVIMFIATVVIMLNGMSNIHSMFSTVTEKSLPLVSLSNQTSVKLLSADKAFKDFLTTQNVERMEQNKRSFKQAQDSFQVIFNQLETASSSYPSLQSNVNQLKELETSYFAVAQEAMGNYQDMFIAQEQVRKSTRDYQRLHSDLTVGMKDFVDDQSSISIKLLAKSYFLKLKKAEMVTSDALASDDLEFVAKAFAENKKSVAQLVYAYQGLTTQLPSLKSTFDKSVEGFTKDIGKKGGVLDQHSAFLLAQENLYQNIENLASEIDQTMTLLAGFNDVATEELNDTLSEAESIYTDGRLQASIIGVVVVILAIVIGYHLAHSVREPLIRIFATLESLADGDMTKRIDIRYNNEFSRVSGHINTLADNLHNILQQLSSASRDLTNASTTNQTTSNNAQSQLNSQREQTANVATAMTEMAHSVAEVSQSALNSLEKVHQVESASDSGREVMNQNITTINQLESRLTESVEAVSELQQMSSEIGSILDVIQGIAEQTNLLALNAAIEAARAGEQGRGFAVVADEVRVLAQKTTESTTEIESMIGNLQSSSKSASHMIESCMGDMENSIAQASNANSSMEEIQALILEISQMSTHISEAAAEQSTTTGEIAQSLEGINHIADDSYQAMSQIASVSDNLSTIAQEQESLVSRFRL
ncbi:methyl-accepting chemotaxis protein [Vibrio algarum]|uniref:Methyl-accepting chemotaxis protein n=1 Tax=Vibrio algarum TaxID=3020714 RepID=A0ABT4YR89_9VIBR|nr:methyl-accepting chemotaxis protein [Vibrio sp. KJ40-1]MDB1123554.1 methyl-accepting chemotaxis protein [Vibrio sp. KJ40-1]